MFYFYGSKKALAPSYPAPTHNLIVEPFAGAAGYSMFWLLKNPELKAVLIDKDPLVVQIWNTLLSIDSNDLVNYPDPIKGERTIDPLYLAATASGGSWAKARKGEPFKITAWMARDFPRLKIRWAEAAERIRGRVSVLSKEYQGFPSSINATWFIDPPYQHQGHQYVEGSSGIDYEFLGTWVRQCRGQVIVTESEPADWLPFQPHHTKNSVNTSQTPNMKNVKKKELVWYAGAH